MVPELELNQLMVFAKTIGDVAVDGKGMEKFWISGGVAKGN